MQFSFRIVDEDLFRKLGGEVKFDSFVETNPNPFRPCTHATTVNLSSGATRIIPFSTQIMDI